MRRVQPTAYSIIILFLSLAGRGFCQEMEISHLEILDNKVLLHYDLIDTVPGRAFTVRLYSSGDGYVTPLERLSGDVGLEVKPGTGKKIVWDPAEQSAGNIVNLALEVRAKVFVPFIKLESLDHYEVFKRGRSYSLTWRGGSPQNILNFDLYRNNVKVATYPNVANVGHHSFVFPVHVKPGKNYRFRISDTKNKEEEVYTSTFRIARKIPLAIKAIPMLIVGGGIAYLIQAFDDRPEVMPAPPPEPE